MEAMKLDRYVVIKENSGGHNAVAFCDVDSYVYLNPSASSSCTIEEISHEIASEEGEPGESVRARIAACNPGLDVAKAAFQAGSLIRVKTEQTPSSQTVLEDIPMAGGKYLKFLKWAIGGIKWAAEKAEGGPTSDAKSRWEATLASRRQQILDQHRAILSALQIPLGENSFERVINKVIPDFLRKRGISSNLLQLMFSRDGYLVFRFQHIRIVTSVPVDAYS